MPAPVFGQAVYDRMLQMKNLNGAAWSVADLAREAGVSGTTVRQWIKGAIPEGRKLTRLAEVLRVDAAALLRGQIKPINLPAAASNGGQAASGHSGTRAGDSATAVVREGSAVPSGQYEALTVEEVRVRFDARMVECRGDMPLAEAVWWVGLALRATRSSPPAGG